jgi:hypothetical protein
MSYFSLKDPNNPVDTVDKIVYNYFSTQINRSDIQTNPNDAGNDTFLKAPFPNNTASYNLVYTGGDGQKNFGTTNIYIYGLLHKNIKDVTANNADIIGELVLEHVTATATAYVCYLIKKSADSTRPTNDVDNIYFLLSDPNSVSANIVLNNLIPEQDNCIIYKSDSDPRKPVFIFTTPIQVNASTAAEIKGYVSTTTLFNINAPTHYTIIPKANIIKQKDEEIYIDCNPTGVSDQEIQSYNVPINSEYSNEKNQIDFMKTTLNFFTFIVGLVFCYFAVPKLYKAIIVDKTILFHEKSSTTVPNIWVRIRSADLWLSLITTCVFLSLLIIGFQNSNYTYITSALFICVFYGLSFSILQNSKLDKEFMTLRTPTLTRFEPYETPAVDGEPIKYFKPMDFLNLAVQSIMFFGRDCVPSYLGAAIMYIIILLLSLYFTGNFNSDKITYYICVGLFAIIPIMVCLIRLMML